MYSAALIAVIVPCLFRPKEESYMYTVLACSAKLLSVLPCWLTTKQLAPRRGSVLTKCAYVQHELSVYTAIRDV